MDENNPIDPSENEEFDISANDTLEASGAENNQEASSEEQKEPELKMMNIPATEYERITKEAREYKEKYLHALAESENSRKRLQKERQEMIQHALQNVIVEFLNPIDQMENALGFAENAAPEVKNWAIGFNMILTQFKDVLSNHGVSPFASEGHPFDPHFHEAIDVVETTEHAPGTVVKETSKGYKINSDKGSSKVIRPARVHVAKAPKEQTEEITE